MLGSGNLGKLWTISARYVDTELQRPRWRFTLDYRFSARFIAGLEYNPAAQELNPVRFTWDIVKETDDAPLISIGTSSDRIGSRKDTRAYYLTVAKAIPGTNIAPYFSLNYSEQNRGVNFPFGMNYQINEAWSLLAMNDGHKSHLLLNYQQRDYWVTVGWIWSERVGVSLGWGF